MLAKKLFEGVRVWSGRIRDQGVDKLQKLIRGARREAVHRVRHNVRVNMLSEMKANCEAARAGILWVIVGNGGNSREIGEARRHRDGNTLNMRCPGQPHSFGRRFELASQQDPLRVRWPEPWMRPAIGLVERLDNVAAKG